LTAPPTVCRRFLTVASVAVEPVTPSSSESSHEALARPPSHQLPPAKRAPTAPAAPLPASERARLPPPSFASVGDIPDDRLASTIALVLTDFCEANKAGRPAFPEPHDPAALFFSPFRQKTFSLNFYCKRLLEYTYCSKSCFVVAILYIVRLSERHPVFELNDFNVHRLICTAVVLAAKFMDDMSFSNVHYAKVAGIRTAGEMNKLEAFMLKALDYRLFVSLESYREVESQIALIARECT
jgi:hypothetical protein